VPLHIEQNPSICIQDRNPNVAEEIMLQQAGIVLRNGTEFDPPIIRDAYEVSPPVMVDDGRADQLGLAEKGAYRAVTSSSVARIAHDARRGEPLPPSVIRILEGALRVVGSRGVRRLSMSDISEASGVSRGTLYRYFATKDELLQAVAEFICSNFEAGIREAADAQLDPIDRFSAVMRFFAKFTAERSLGGIFEAEASFHISFFRSHFERHKAAVKGALEVTFDHLERRHGMPIDRDTSVETLVRLQLSTLIVPTGARWSEAWECAPERLEEWMTGTVGTPARAKEQRDADRNPMR
jgi:AcrR family transcriptional regulator